jgi:hypothetical protein
MRRERGEDGADAAMGRSTDGVGRRSRRSLDCVAAGRLRHHHGGAHAEDAGSHPSGYHHVDDESDHDHDLVDHQHH